MASCITMIKALIIVFSTDRVLSIRGSRCALEGMEVALCLSSILQMEKLGLTQAE